MSYLLKQGAKDSYLIAVMIEKLMYCFAVQETLMLGKVVVKRKGYTLYNSGQLAGSPRNGHRNGVGIIIRNDHVKDIMKAYCKNDRMMAIIGNFEGRLTTIISVYAPHNKLPKEEKNNFYEELLDMLRKSWLKSVK
jgi:exonuclease III